MNRPCSGKKTLLITFVAAFLLTASESYGEPASQVSPDARCAVCGMFVARYPDWTAQIHYEAPAGVQSFDGVKDMMVFYFSPERFDDTRSAAISEIRVKDYYTLEWFDGRQAFYAVGSDVYGPMGHEFIPFKTRAAAESFMKDHRARKILMFEQITPELVESIRAGQKMR